MNKIIKTPSILGFYPVILFNHQSNFGKSFESHCFTEGLFLNIIFKIFAYKKIHKDVEYFLAPDEIKKDVDYIDENYYFYEYTPTTWQFGYIINNIEYKIVKNFKNDEEMIKYIKKYFRKDYINYLKRNIL